MSEALRFYNENDPCPECATRLIMDPGEPQSWHSPEEPPALFCPNCGIDYQVDWERYGNEET